MGVCINRLINHIGSTVLLFLSLLTLTWGNQSSVNCPTGKLDLMIVLDTSSSVFLDFQNELETAIDLIDQLPSSIFDDPLQMAVVQFHSYNNLAVPFEIGRSKEEIIEKIQSIEFTGGSTRISEAIVRGLEELNRARRMDAKQIIVLISDGHGQDYWHVVLDTSRRLKTDKVDIFVGTVSADFNQVELTIFAGSTDRAFFGHRQHQFVPTVVRLLGECLNLGSRTTERPSVTDKVLPVQDSCSIDLVFVIDTSGSVSADFHKELQFATDLIGSTPEVLFNERIAVAAVAFSIDATLEFGLNDLRGRRRVLDRLSRIKFTGGSTSLVAGVDLAIRVINRERRPDAKLIVVIISDGNSQDPWVSLVDTSRRLKALDAIIYAVPLSRNYFLPELLIYAEHEDFVFIDKPLEQLIEAARLSDVDCGQSPVLPGHPCPNELVDLLLMIDSSGFKSSFNADVSFAIDLVKIFPPVDFERHLSVAIVKFGKTANIEMKFASAQDQQTILNTLKRIEFTGGAASTVTGFKKGLEEIQRGRRSGSRLVIVLVSGGNSQDPLELSEQMADSVHQTDAQVFVVTKSRSYDRRELDLYAGSSGRVFVDENVSNLIRIVSDSIVHCQGDSTMIAPRRLTTTFPNLSLDPLSFCRMITVDLMIVIDTSGSVADHFRWQLKMAVDLVKELPIDQLQRHFSIAVVEFHTTASVVLEFGSTDQHQVVSLIEGIRFSGGASSTVSAFDVALKEIARGHRNGARLVIVLVSAGHSLDDISSVRTVAGRVHRTGAEVYSVTKTPIYSLQGLEIYAGHPSRVFVDEKTDHFLQVVVSSIQHCPEKVRPPAIPPSSSITPIDGSFSGLNIIGPGQVVQNADRTKFVVGPIPPNQHKCQFSKMDLVIILDASTSRHEVFEHQRELALSLVERLPISSDGTHVAIGITSFTSTPILRLQLGLGRNKQFVRQSIRVRNNSDNWQLSRFVASLQDIVYRGGSTHTARAVRLALHDLDQSRRSDAVQVVVLMSDGISQDFWHEVLKTSKQLKESGAELFGVALGQKLDMVELELYIGNKERIYDDGRMERLLDDVVKLLGADINCIEKSSPIISDKHIHNDPCLMSKLDLVVIFDTSNQGIDQSLFEINRQLLLDILGSLPFYPESDRIRLSLVSFAHKAILKISSSANQSRASIFDKISTMDYFGGEALYANAVFFAVSEYERAKRPDAKPLFLIIGNGKSNDQLQQIEKATSKLRQIPNLECLAVHNGQVTRDRLAFYTGSPEKVYDYSQNEEFARAIGNMVTVPVDRQCMLAVEKHVARDLALMPSLIKDSGVKGIVKAPITSTRGCPMDLMLILDASSSVNGTYERQKEIAAKVIRRLDISKEITRLALINYAGDQSIRSIFSFGEYLNSSAALRALNDQTPFVGGLTSTAKALQLARRQFGMDKGARPGVALPAVIVFTDGFARRNTTSSAVSLRHLVSRVYAVAVSDIVNRNGLIDIVGDERHLFIGRKINQLFPTIDRFASYCIQK